jgi:hypothetical protein
MVESPVQVVKPITGRVARAGYIGPACMPGTVGTQYQYWTVLFMLPISNTLVSDLLSIPVARPTSCGCLPGCRAAGKAWAMRALLAGRLSCGCREVDVGMCQCDSVTPLVCERELT